VIVEVTADDIDRVQRVADRIEAQSARLRAETGLGGRPRIGAGYIAAELRRGDRIFLARDDDPGVEPERIVVWLGRVGPRIIIKHMWGPSRRHLPIVRFTCRKLIEAGAGNLFGHFPNVPMPIVQKAAAIVLPEAGAYADGSFGGAWIPDANGPLYRVRMNDALPRLIAAGVSDEPG